VRSPKLGTLCAVVIGVALVWARPAAGLGSCTITTTSGVAFGSYDVLSSSPVDSTGLLHVACTLTGLLITVDLSKGNAPTYNPRFMLKGGAPLNYNLYLDPARTLIWGDNTGGSSHYTSGVLVLSLDLTIYGRIPAGQDVTAGAYSDTVTATVNF